MALPLVVGLVDDANRKRILHNLVNSIRANSDVQTSGEVGYGYVLYALDQGGHSQLIYKMNARNDVPGYGYQIKKGKTALTETWAGHGISQDHLMLGEIMEWFYGGLAGIRQTKDSHAYDHILIKPAVEVGNIKWVRASFYSPDGRIYSNWSLDNQVCTLKVKIPVNAIATIVIPSRQVAQITESNKPVTSDPEILSIIPQHQSTRIKIGSGKWSFKFPIKNSM
jgi:hypothetical protein